MEQENKTAAAGTPYAKRRRRRRSPITDGASSSVLCDDVVGNILARVPARTAVASMALSRRHRRLIRSAEFRSLHRRLAPPLPRPHIAYLVTATMRPRRERNDEVPASAFHGFHVAGAGGFDGNAPTPVRSLAGRRFSGVGYINTCNGVVLLASAGDCHADSASARSSRCVLWNPAVADVVEEVFVPAAHADPVADDDSDADDGSDADDSTRAAEEYHALGLGYGQRSKTYKLVLVCRRRKKSAPARRGRLGRRMDGPENYLLSLVTYALADDHGKQKQPTEMELPAAVRDGAEISQHSLYLDGKIYLLFNQSEKNPAAIVLAFDVDDDTFTSIDLPIVRHPDGFGSGKTSGLMELSGRPCVATQYGAGIALWLLSVDHQLHRMCLIGDPPSENHIYPCSIIGVWDCGGVLVLCYKDNLFNHDRLFLYDLTAGKMFRANMECLEPSASELALCWGYRPTLEAPSSVVGKLMQDDQDGCRECSTYIMKALKPVAEQDRRKGQEATLNTVCFVDFLVRIMQKLPKDMQQVLEMKMIDSDDPDFTFENVFFEARVRDEADEWLVAGHPTLSPFRAT